MKSSCKLLKSTLLIMAILVSLLVLASCGAKCSHTGGTATCCAKAVCSNCGKQYGDFDSTNHTSEEFSYSVNSGDFTKHDKMYECCELFIETELHTWNDGVETQSPNATDSGVMTYTCTLCEYQKTETIPNLSHVHNPEHIEANDPDCDEDGNIEYWYCEGCDKYFADSALTAMILRESTVISAGHRGGVATCSSLAVCAGCGDTYGQLDVNNHAESGFDYVINSSDDTKHDKSHSCCGKLVETVAHEFITYVNNGDATCNSNATETARCACGKTHTREIADSFSDNHSLVLVSSAAATCTEPARNNYKCSACTGHTESVVTAPPTGHSISKRNVKSVSLVSGTTCEYDVVYAVSCSNCNVECEEETERETRHTYVATIKTAATCCCAGVKSYTCMYNCTDTGYDAEYVDTNAHSFVAYGEPIGSAQTYKCNNGSCTVQKSVISLSGNKINKSEIADNEIKVGEVSIKLDTSTLSKLSDGEVVIGALPLGASERAAAVGKLSTANRTLLGERAIYDFSLAQGDNVISDFDGGRVNITLPYTLANGEDPDCIVVWFISDSGEVTALPATYSNGYVSFEATHFSMYAPTGTTAEDACAINGHNYIELEGGKVNATCDTIGYTTKFCTRCADTYIADVVYELGHKYTAEPQIIASTCNTYGKYIYTCQADGCTHVQEVPILPSHNLEFFESKDANCIEDGYYKSKCSDCGYIKTTVYPKNEYYHEYKTDYKLVDGATSCSGGVIEYRTCKVVGCEYSETVRTFNEHLDVKLTDGDGNYIMPEFDTVKLSDYIDFSRFGYTSGSEPNIVAYKAACVCGKIYNRIEFYDDSGNFGSINIDSDFEGEERLEFSNGLNPQYGGINITVLFRTVIEYGDDSPCYAKKTLEILIDYNSSDDSAAASYRYVMADGYNHKNTYNVYYLKPGAELCEDGVECTLNCRDCDTEINRWDDYVSGGTHKYNYIYLPYDLSVYSSMGHETYIREARCPCGMSKLEVKTGNTNATKCVFTKTTTTRDDGATVTRYTCSCGIMFDEVTKKNVQFDDCTYRSYQTIYYDYNTETQSYTKATASAYIDSFSHRYKTHKEYTYTNGCYVEYTATLKCSCGRVYPYYEEDYTSYEHDLDKVVSYDSMHNKLVTSSCKDCDYMSVSLYDENDNVLSFYEQIYNPKSGIKQIERSNYRFISGEMRKVLYKQECYSILDGEFISWTQTSYLYTFGTTRGCYVIEFITNSDGGFEIKERCLCDSSEYVYNEPTCTQWGEEGYKCSVCGLGETRALYPEGHYWMGGYDENTYVCDRCGAVGNDYIDKAVVLEKLSCDDVTIEIGYFNRYSGSIDTGIDGSVKLEVVLSDGVTRVIEVDYVDDGRSVITVNRADIDYAIGALGLSAGARYSVQLSVHVEMYGETVTLELFNGVTE